MTKTREWIKYTCRFCEEELEDFKFLIPQCECEGYQNAKADHLKEIENSPDFQPDMSQKEYDQKFPIVHFDDRLILGENTEEGYKLTLEARRFTQGIGLSILRTFPGVSKDVSFAWDFSHVDAEVLHDLLSDYLSKEKH